MMFEREGGAPAKQLKIGKAETPEQAKMRFELDGYSFDGTEEIVEINGAKFFVKEGHPDHPKTKEEEEAKEFQAEQEGKAPPPK